MPRFTWRSRRIQKSFGDEREHSSTKLHARTFTKGEAVPIMLLSKSFEVKYNSVSTMLSLVFKALSTLLVCRTTDARQDAHLVIAQVFG